MKNTETVLNEMINEIKNLKFEELNRAVQITNKEFEYEELINELLEETKKNYEVCLIFEEYNPYNIFYITNRTSSKKRQIHINNPINNMEEAA